MGADTNEIDTRDEDLARTNRRLRELWEKDLLKIIEEEEYKLNKKEMKMEREKDRSAVGIKAESKSTINKQLELLYIELERYTTRVNTLESVFSRVLSSDHTSDEEKMKIDCCDVSFANDIIDIVNRLRINNDILDNIVFRCAL